MNLIKTPTRKAEKSSLFTYTDSKIYPALEDPRLLKTAEPRKTLDLDRVEITPERTTSNRVVDSYYERESEDFTIVKLQEPQVKRDRALGVSSLGDTTRQKVSQNPIFTERDSAFMRKIQSMKNASAEEPDADILDPYAQFHSHLLFHYDLDSSKTLNLHFKPPLTSVS